MHVSGGMIAPETHKIDRGFESNASRRREKGSTGKARSGTERGGSAIRHRSEESTMIASRHPRDCIQANTTASAGAHEMPEGTYRGEVKDMPQGETQMRSGRSKRDA